jgi:Nucleotidyltransferase domain
VAPNTEIIVGLLGRYGVCRKDDVVFVGGSAAYGLATPYSDVDVFIIRQNGAVAPDGVRLVPMPDDEVPIDLEIWSASEVDSLLDRVARMQVGAQADYRTFMQLSEDQRDFLHSLLCALPVLNESSLATLQAKVPAQLLAHLSMERALLGISNAQIDLLGWLAAGDWQSACTGCQKMLDFAGLALLASAGCTHPGGKWTLTLLRRFFDDQSIPPRLLGNATTLADRLYSLQCKPDCAAATPAYTEECTRFVNSAVIWAQLADKPHLKSVLQSAFWSQSPSGGHDTGPALSCKAQLRLADDGCYLINVKHEMYKVNTVAMTMLLMMDSRTSEQIICELAMAGGGAEPNKLRTALHDLVLFLENANLLAGPSSPN